MCAVTIDELTLAGDPGAWERLGFAVDDGVCQIGAVRVRLVGEQTGAGIVGWSLREIETVDLDGLPTTVSRAPDTAAAPGHANGALAIDHVVAMTPALERSVRALQAAGLDLRRIREEPTAAGAPRQAFFRLGAEILELVQEPPEVVERAGGAAHPARFWGLALTMADLERAADAFGGELGSIRPAVQHGRMIATVKRSAGLSVPLALMSVRDENGDGRPR